MRHTEAADHIADTNAEMCTDAFECNLRASFAGVCARDQVREPERRIVPGATSVAALEFDRARR